MKKMLFILSLLYSISAVSQPLKDSLFRFSMHEAYQLGVPSGYLNTKGDTVIPINKYIYCFTDTGTNFIIVMDSNHLCHAIDLKGAFLYEVYWFDNGPDPVSEGCFRIKKEGKIGFANTKGEIIIEPRFKCSNPFYKGLARVTLECSTFQDSEHHSLMQSDKWFYINKKGGISHYE